MIEYRAAFDADVTFLNGGGLQVQGFRLDVPGPEVAEDALADLFVRELGLLMVGEVRLAGVRVFAESHKGTRTAAPAPAGGAKRRLVELSHVITAGMTTYPGLP